MEHLAELLKLAAFEIPKKLNLIYSKLNPNQL